MQIIIPVCEGLHFHVLDTPTLIGIDEAGRGPLAGPVVAAACILPHSLTRRRGTRGWSPFRTKPKQDCIIADSKLLSETQRAIAYAWIAAHCRYGIGVVSASDIDAMGIKKATHTAMLLALEELEVTEEVALLIDGNDRFAFDYPNTCIVKGDQKEPCIAAASILAKVTRDRIMLREHAEHPVYGFDGHKGYGSETHREAIKKHGPCRIHRISFLTNVLNEQLILDA